MIELEIGWRLLVAIAILAGVYLICNAEETK